MPQGIASVLKVVAGQLSPFGLASASKHFRVRWAAYYVLSITVKFNAVIHDATKSAMSLISLG